MVNLIIVYLPICRPRNTWKNSSIYGLNLFRLNALEDPNLVFIVDTIPQIVSTNLKVNFPVVSVIRASLFYIIISGVLRETL